MIELLNRKKMPLKKRKEIDSFIEEIILTKTDLDYADVIKFIFHE